MIEQLAKWYNAFLIGAVELFVTFNLKTKYTTQLGYELCLVISGITLGIAISQLVRRSLEGKI